MSPAALAGKRVLVTRALRQAGRLSAGLRERGAVAVEVPVLEIQPPESFAGLDRALAAIDSYDWLVLTSANAVEALVERARGLAVALRQPDGLWVVAIGDATAAAAEKAGLRVALVPDRYVAESLLDRLMPLIEAEPRKQKILVARAASARDVIPESLRAAGAEVDVVDAYRNGLPERAAEELRLALAGGIDLATFTSSSSATHLQEAALAAGLDWPLRGVLAVSIGPVTSATLRELGWEPAAEAEESEIAGLIAAVERAAG